MARLAPALLFLSLALVITTSRTLDATDLVRVDGSCPVCGQKLVLHQVVSSNNFGGRDRDLCEHAVGEQALLVAPHTCPRCLFSGYPEEFSSPASESLKQLVLRQRVLRAAGELSKAWVRHDLIAQRLLLEGAPPERLGEQYLRTAWAVRLGDGGGFDALAAELAAGEDSWFRLQLLGGKFVVRRENGEAELAIEMAEAAASRIAALPRDKGRAASILAGHLLRARGENQILLKLLPLLQVPFDPSEWTALEDSVRRSIAVEERYQRLALGEFSKALEQTDHLLAEERRALLTYLCGELARRIGDKQRAAALYRRVPSLAGAPDWLQQWSREQLAVLDKQ